MSDDPIDLSEVRRRAWQTRREKYGDAGHARGAYRRSPEISREAIEEARDELSSIRRGLQVYGLPDEWAHRAIASTEPTICSVDLLRSSCCHRGTFRRSDRSTLGSSARINMLHG